MEGRHERKGEEPSGEWVPGAQGQCVLQDKDTYFEKEE